MKHGFTLIELLIALTITLLIAGALAQAMPAARDAFDRLPAELEMHQRGRAAIDALSQALRAAERVSVAKPDVNGTFAELAVVTPLASPAQGVLSVDQTAPNAAMTLALSPCPNIKDVCGFAAGTVAMVADDSGHFDVFIVSSTNTAARQVTPKSALSRAYPAGSRLVEVEEHTFGLDQQPDGTYSLIRVTAAGAVQPMVDFISALTFDWHAQQVDIVLSVQTANESLRTRVAERTFRMSVAVRNRHE